MLTDPLLRSSVLYRTDSGSVLALSRIKSLWIARAFYMRPIESTCLLSRKDHFAAPSYLCTLAHQDGPVHFNQDAVGNQCTQSVDYG
jgi:hypothetical protein